VNTLFTARNNVKPPQNTKEKPNIHKGHRIRLKEKYKAYGIEALHEHEILELLLFFGIPLKDTNEISHKLINKFGSLSAVFDADHHSLKAEKNMTHNAALLIRLCSDISRLYLNNQSSTEKVYDTKEKIGAYINSKYAGVDGERIILVLFDNSHHIIDTVSIGTGSNTLSEVNIGKIVKTANSRNVSRVAIAHNHPDNSDISTSDIVSSRKIAYHLNSVGIELIESFVITSNRVLNVFDSMPICKKRKRTKKEAEL